MAAAGIVAGIAPTLLALAPLGLTMPANAMLPIPDGLRLDLQGEHLMWRHVACNMRPYDLSTTPRAMQITQLNLHSAQPGLSCNEPPPCLLCAGQAVYEDDEDEHVVEGEQLSEALTLTLQAAPQDGKPAVDAAAIIRRIKEEQVNNDSPSKRLDVLAGLSRG